MANSALTISEAWNHRIGHLCGVSHPSVWKLIHWLKADSAHVSTTLLNAARGEPPRNRVKRVYTQLQSRLHQLCYAGNLMVTKIKWLSDR